MNRNIELKARCPDLAAAHGRATTLGAVLHGEERQRDTYFRVAAGRLKLRERWPGRTTVASPHEPSSTDSPQLSQLIWYCRRDDARPRPSDYSLIVVHDGDGLCALLANALGVVAEVNKHRAIYIHDNVRIHLDDVAGRGTFLEFEAIVDETCDDAAAHAKLDRLRAVFGISQEQVLSQSYADMGEA